MIKNKWTPGPWSISEVNTSNSNWDSYSVGSFYSEVCQVRSSKSPMIDWMASRQELEANAHLIAAAPELYDILQRCRDMGFLTVGYDSGPDHKKLCAHAETVMGKARGEEK